MINLKSLIVESISLDEQIEDYFTLQANLQAKRKQLESEIKKLKDLESSVKMKFTKIQKFMIEHKIDQKRVKDWVARLVTIAKYKKIQPDYKQLWQEALTKVNEATRKILEALSEANTQAKKAATVIQLQIKQQGIADLLSKLWGKINNLISSFSLYRKVSSNLPKLS